MTGTAILFLILAVVVVWGGLAMAIVFYRRSGASRGGPPEPREDRLGRHRDG